MKAQADGSRPVLLPRRRRASASSSGGSCDASWRALAQAGTPESRRYRLVGVVNDQEVTPPSDVVTIAIAD
jgi:hypothetical protein